MDINFGKWVSQNNAYEIRQTLMPIARTISKNRNELPPGNRYTRINVDDYSGSRFSRKRHDPEGVDSDNDLYLVFNGYLSQKQLEVVKNPPRNKEVFGIKVPNIVNSKNQIIRPLNEGIVIRDERGYEVAEVINNMVLVYLPIPKSQTNFVGKRIQRKYLTILRRIMLEYLDIIGIDVENEKEEEYKEDVEKKESKPIEDNSSEKTNETLETLKELVGGEIQRSKQELENVQKEIERYSELVSEKQRRVISIMDGLNASEERVKEECEKMSNEILRIKQINGIEDVRIGRSYFDSPHRQGRRYSYGMYRDSRYDDRMRNMSGISIITDHIFMPLGDEEGHKLLAGKYEIFIPIHRGVVNTPKISNIDESVSIKAFWHGGSRPSSHPHINYEGEPCWGDVSDTVRALCKDLEFEALTVLCTSFLSSFNPGDSAGVDAIRWPLYTKDGKKLTDGFSGMSVSYNYQSNHFMETGKSHPYPVSEMRKCDQCSGAFADENTSIVKDRSGDGERRLCNECYSENTLECSCCGEANYYNARYPGERCDTCGNYVCDDCSTYRDHPSGVIRTKICTSCAEKEPDNNDNEDANSDKFTCSKCEEEKDESDKNICFMCDAEDVCGDCMVDNDFLCKPCRDRAAAED